jgi:hypothetical protein
MNYLVLILATFITASTVLVNQRAALRKTQGANAQLAAQARALETRLGELRERRDYFDHRLSASKERLGTLRQNLKNTPVPQFAEPLPPDPARHGGWPADAAYFYLPKKNLNTVGYQLFAGHRLTDDAATLFGMTAAEREAVDAAYGNLWRKFRELEIQRMEPAEKPAIWNEPADQESVTRRFPSLAKETGELLAGFTSALQNILGTVRAGYVLETAQAYFTSQLDDLGQAARIITIWRGSADGNQKPWFGILREGSYGDVQMIQFPVEPDSTIAYYAQLFGVEVPIQAEP